jgi:hypothetical protein
LSDSLPLLDASTTAAQDSAAVSIVAATPQPAAIIPPRRGSEKRQRHHVARLRLDDDEHAKLEERASASGLSTGAYLRAAALGRAGVRAKPRASVDRQLLARANADLNRVGNNINQIAHALNAGRDPPHHLAEAMTDLRGVLSALRRAAGYDRQG